MKIRTTERKHKFTKRLFEKLNIYNLQGLTLNDDLEFTAGIEAIDYGPNETIDLRRIFDRKYAVEAKCHLTQVLGIPLFFIIHQKSFFKVFEVIELETESYSYELRHEFDEKKFCEWWRSIKTTIQTKGLFEASQRVGESSIDNILTRNGLCWGGNIDGFMLKDQKVLAIIENIYTQKNPLESDWANPAVYFHKRGPNYNSWEPPVLLSQKIDVPLFLFTLEGNNNKERIGFSVIDKLSQSGIYYRKNVSPNHNIIEGIDKITETIYLNLRQTSPDIQ